MIINRHNLTIAKHCGNPPDATGVGDVANLKFTEQGTVAANGHYMLLVSAVEPGTAEVGPYVSPESAELALEMMGDEHFDPAFAGMYPVPTKGFNEAAIVTVKPVTFEMFMNSTYLRRMAEEIEQFAGPERNVRIQFVAVNQPVRFTVVQPQTKQTLDAYVTACDPSKARQGFKDDGGAI